MEPHTSASKRETYQAYKNMPTTSFVFMLVIFIMAFSQALFINYDLRTEKSALNAQIARQKAPINEAEKLREQLESIAGATAVLAEQGNKNALFIREQLQKQGVNIRPPKPDYLVN